MNDQIKKNSKEIEKVSKDLNNLMERINLHKNSTPLLGVNNKTPIAPIKKTKRMRSSSSSKKKSQKREKKEPKKLKFQ